MKRPWLFRFIIISLAISLSAGLMPAQDKVAQKLAKAEAKLEKILGTNTNWKPTIFKNLRYGMPCKEVKKHFPGLKCNTFKKFDFPKVPGKLLSAVKEYQFTFKYGKLDSIAIVFGARAFDSKRFATALLNVTQRKWGKLSPEKLSKKFIYWYNSDRDSVSLTYFKTNWQLKVSMPKRDTGEVTAGTLSAEEIRVQLAKLLGSSKSWIVPAMSKFKRGMNCTQVMQVYKTMKNCDPTKNYSTGVVTIKNHPLVHVLKFTFSKGELKSAAIVFHRQLDKELFKQISQDLFQAKWGKLAPGKLNQDILTIYKTNFGVAQRSFSVDHWEIKQDFPPVKFGKMSKKNKHEQFFLHMEKLIGSEQAHHLIAALDHKSPKAVRYNRRTCTTDRLAGDAVPWCQPYGRYWGGEIFPSRTIDYAVGNYYIQEASAMLPVAAASQVIDFSDKIVLDLTAAPGGKTTQTAELLKTGYLLANEVIHKRVDALVWNINRHRLHNVAVTSLATDVLAEALPRFFDIVLVDAPCSGEGLLLKKQHSPIKWSQKNVRICAHRQQTILDDAIKMVCPEGYLVYSTCTFSQEENENQVEYLLTRGFTPVSLPPADTLPVSPAISENKDILSCSRRIFPHHETGAGAFVAVLQKEPDTRGYVPRTGCKFHHPKKETDKVVTLPFLDAEAIKDSLYQHNAIISYFPHHRLPSFIHDNAYQIGAPLFDKRRDNEPMYGAVQFPSPETFIQLNQKDAFDYVHGLELHLDHPDGYYWGQYNGITLGGMKISNHRAVNKFPKPLRII